MNGRSPLGGGPQPKSAINESILPNPAIDAAVLAEWIRLEEIRHARQARLGRLNLLPRHPMTFEECRRVVIFEAMVVRHFKLNEAAA